MFATIINGLAIVGGSIIGLLFKKGVKESYQKSLMDAIGLSVLIIGISGALKTENILLMIISLTLGVLIGEIFKLEDKLENLGHFLRKISKQKEGSFIEGFTSATLMFGVGAMAIVGSMEAGIYGDYKILFAKSILDGLSSIIFASTMGIGVLFSSIPVVLYQGFITLCSKVIHPFLNEAMIREISAVGNVLIVAIALGNLKIKKIKVGNLLPALLIPVLYYLFV